MPYVIKRLSDGKWRQSGKGWNFHSDLGRARVFPRRVDAINGIRMVCDPPQDTSIGIIALPGGQLAAAPTKPVPPPNWDPTNFTVVEVRHSIEVLDDAA